MTRSASRRPTVAAACSVAALLAIASCAGGSASSLSPEGERGRQIANTRGCAACHGTNGQGGVGPAWVGLAGAEVELLDGSFVVADDDYLVRAIEEPAADLRAGYTLQMPRNDLSSSEVAAVLAYIDDLTAESDGA